MDLDEWRGLATWIATVWPAPGYEARQVEAAYFIVREVDAADAKAALQEHALAEGVPSTPHPSEVRQIAQRWVRAKRRRPQVGDGDGDIEPESAPAGARADDELVASLVRDLRRGLGRRSPDPIGAVDGAVVEAGRRRVRRLRSMASVLEDPD